MNIRLNSYALAIAFAASASLPLAATAAGDQPAAPPAGGSSAAATAGSICSELDTNKDGFVTREEAKRSAEISANFDKIDANHVGKISMSGCVSYLTRGTAGGAAGRPAPAGPQGPAGSPGAGGSPGADQPPGPAGPSSSPKSNY